MTIFEYLMVLVSIVLALGLTQLLRGFGKIARGGRERRFAPLTWWAVTLAVLHVQVWWGLWDFHQVDQGEWTQISFFAIVLFPALLFAATEFLVPAHATHDMAWEDHFFRVRRWFFGVFTVFQVVGISLTRLLLDVPLTHPYRIPQGALTLIALSGLLTERRGRHLWIAIAYLVVFLSGQVAFRLFPTGL